MKSLVIVCLIPCALQAQNLYWLETEGPYGGVVYRLHANGKGEMVAATERSLFYSSDWGQMWIDISRKISSPYPYAGFSSAAITEDGVVYFDYQSSFYSTKDFGFTIDRVKQIPAGQNVQHIDIDSRGNITLGAYGGGIEPGGIYRSWDKGLSWAKLAPDSVIWVDALTTTPEGTILTSRYVKGNWSGVLYRSTDDGNRWTLVPIPGFAGLGNATVTHLVKGYDDQITLGVYAGTAPGSYRDSYVYTAREDGTMLQRVSSAIRDNSFRSMMVTSVGNVFAGTSDGVLFKPRASMNWEKKKILEHYPIAWSMLSTINRDLFIGLYGGLAKSPDNGGSWFLTNRGLKATQCNTLTFGSDGRLFAGTAYSGLFYSDDKGKSWVHATHDSIRAINAIVEHPSGVLFATYNWISTFYRSGLLRSTDRGATWGPSPVIGRSQKGTMISDKEGTLYIGSISDSGYVLRSTDAGTTWSQYRIPGNAGTIHCLGLDSLGNLYAGTRENGLLRSTDRGETWSSLSPTSHRVTAFAAAPDGGLWYATQWIYRSIDSGITWTQHRYVGDSRALTVSKSGVLFHSGFRTTSFSADNGATWKDVRTGYFFSSFSFPVNSFAFDANDILYGGTDGYGVIKSISNYEYGIPRTPALIMPVNGAENRPKADTLRWEAVHHATSYYVEIAKDSLFRSPVLREYLLRNILPLPILADSQKFYWRVHARNDFGQSPWSETWSFTVKDERIKPPYAFSVSSGFPLPASSIVEFDIQHQTNEIPNTEVFNALGQRQSVRIDRINISHGVWRIRINTESLFSGLYLTKFALSGNTEMKRLLILK